MPSHTTDITVTSDGWRQNILRWTKVRDVLSDEDQVRDRGTTYLPKPRGMKDQDYLNYAKRANFYGIAERTLRGLTGLVFRIAPVFTPPPALEHLTEEATVEGYSMDQALEEAISEVLSIGRYGILTDLPAGSEKPVFATYLAEDIIDWAESFTPGKRTLTRVVVREEPDTSGEKDMLIIRELLLDENGEYVQHIWKAEDTQSRTTSSARAFHRPLTVRQFNIQGDYEIKETFRPLRRGVPMTEIPFVFINVRDLRPRPVKPPMLDMANVNLALWRNSADYEQSLFMTGQPTAYLFGVPKEDAPKAIGASTMWTSQARDVKVGYLEFNGHGLGPLRTAMLDKKADMSNLGARLINEAAADNVTAETTRLQGRSDTSVLVSAVNSVAKGFTKSLGFATAWTTAAKNPDPVGVTLNSDFIETRMSPEELEKIVTTWQAGAISRDTMHSNLQRGEIVAPDRTVEDEAALIEEEDEKGFGPTEDTPPELGDDPPADEPASDE